MATGRRVRLERLAPRHIVALSQITGSTAAISHWPLLGRAVGVDELWEHLWHQSPMQVAITRRLDGTVVGLLQGLDADARSGTIGIGVMIDADLWRAGWPIEGVILFIDHLVNVLGYRKVYAHTPASVLHTAGDGALGVFMRREATYTRHLRRGDDYEDLHVLALHRNDWRVPEGLVAGAARSRASTRTAGDPRTGEPPLDLDGFVTRLDDLLFLGVAEPDPNLDLVDDLELDSLGMYELIVTVEDLAGVLSAEPEPPPMATLGDVYAYYQRIA